MSESDSGGGDEADEAEILALESIITGYSEDFLKSEFVEEVMKATLDDKSLWEQWAENLDTVPSDCAKAVKALNAHMDSKEVLAFRQSLMEIATAVAMAYREMDDEVPLGEKVSFYLNFYTDVIKAKLKKEQPPSLDEALNISRAERAVLAKLSKALQVDLEGNALDSKAAA